MGPHPDCGFERCFCNKHGVATTPLMPVFQREPGLGRRVCPRRLWGLVSAPGVGGVCRPQVTQPGRSLTLLGPSSVGWPAFPRHQKHRVCECFTSPFEGCGCVCVCARTRFRAWDVCEVSVRVCGAHVCRCTGTCVFRACASRAHGKAPLAPVCPWGR